MSVEPEPQAPGSRWPVPPRGGWTADDLDQLPDLPPHTELIDGSLVFVSPQTLFHTRAVSFFEWQLQSVVPDDLEVVREFTIDIDWQNRPEPDVVVVEGEAIRSMNQTHFPAEAVRLAIEVVSPESKSRDRETKPLKYARVRIPHFWRVENDNDRAVVHVFALDQSTGHYARTGTFHDRLEVAVPFPVDLDLTTITARRRPLGQQ
ncbi:Uma2 family endonuclease [Streptomyces hebeiensis]|uniref:Uma2 family endonuclease n=1 Tax=Streptomyces hebeiensis TaxID=229486 RepID=A0ABN1UK40_9ACTN